MIDSSIQFQSYPLPFFLRLPNRAAEILAPNACLTPPQLTKSAARAADLPANFPGHVEQALEIYCKSLRDDANLHWFGRANCRTALVTGLRSFLEIEQAFRDDPSLSTTPLLSPIIVIGLPRSGTTFLHRLLSASGDTAGITLAHHLFPMPRRPLDTRLLDCRLLFEPWKRASRPYGMDAMHLVRPALPDECNWGMRLGGRSMLYFSIAPAYSYLPWLLDQEMRETYALYRKALIFHQRQFPGRRLVLKCPHHLAWLPALAEAVPEAHLVETHRDPAETLASECKLNLSLHALATPKLNLKKSVEHTLLKCGTFADRAVTFADSAQGNRVHHVNYKSLVKDPVGLARDIRQALQLPFDEGHEQVLRAFAGQNKQHKHGRNPYTLEQFGLDREWVNRRFRSYQERFLAV